MEDGDGLALCTTDEPPAESGDFEITDMESDEQLRIETGFDNFRITDYGTAMLKNRWLRSDGMTPNTGVITLGCFFMSGSTRQRGLIMRSAQEWLRDGIEDVIRFDFTAQKQRSQIRVMVGGRANNSTVGREALLVSKEKQTMNLANLNRGTIQHEFGHALGLLHEHMHPGFTGQFNPVAVKQDLGSIWDDEKINHNILNRLGANAQCVGDPQFHAKSIMMYNIPRTWTTNGQSFRRANEIQSRDIACVRGLYGV